MTLYENILTVIILMGLIFIGYAKIKGRTMGETLIELKEAVGMGIQEIDTR